LLEQGHRDRHERLARAEDAGSLLDRERPPRLTLVVPEAARDADSLVHGEHAAATYDELAAGKTPSACCRRKLSTTFARRSGSIGGVPSLAQAIRCADLGTPPSPPQGATTPGVHDATGARTIPTARGATACLQGRTSAFRPERVAPKGARDGGIEPEPRFRANRVGAPAHCSEAPVGAGRGRRASRPPRGEAFHAVEPSPKPASSHARCHRGIAPTGGRHRCRSPFRSTCCQTPCHHLDRDRRRWMEAGSPAGGTSPSLHGPFHPVPRLGSPPFPWCVARAPFTPA
jgi:hypothetical protein